MTRKVLKGMEAIIILSVAAGYVATALVCILCRKTLRKTCDILWAELPGFEDDSPVTPAGLRRLLESPTDGAESGVVARFDGEGKWRFVSIR